MRLLLGTVLFFTTVAAQADILFAPSLTYIKLDTDDGTTSSEETRTGFDIRLGYFEKAGLYIGGIHSIFNNEVNSTETETTSTGLTVGYKYKNGFYGMLSYYLMSEYDSGVGSKYTDGMGPQIDIGWMFNLSDTVYLGPTFTWRSIKYKKLDTNGVETSADFEVTTITPYVSLWFRF